MKKQENNTCLSEFMKIDSSFLAYIIQQDEDWLSEFMERAEGVEAALKELKQVLKMNEDDFSSVNNFHKMITLLCSTLDPDLLQERKNEYFKKMQDLFFMVPPDVRESLFSFTHHGKSE